jgi:Tol biopolymer transport system component
LGGVALAVGVGVAGAGGTQPTSHFVGNDAPAWSPDGRTVAFTSFQRGRFGDIFRMAPDGSSRVRLTSTDAHDDLPTWSPDGGQIAFVTGRDGSFQIDVMNADGTARRALTTSQGLNADPSWSPDGSKIAFRSTRDGNGEIYVMDAEGGNQTRLTNNRFPDSAPVWSPDGTRIAFTSDRTAEKLFVMDADGTNERRVTNDTVAFHDEERPDWSPDGRAIAFVSNVNPPVGNTDIYVVELDNGAPRRITRNALREDWPAWSPDSRRIAFSRGFHEFRPELYLMNADGSGARKLTGMTLRFAGVTRTPLRPRAGRPFTIDLAVRPRLDRFADPICIAVVGKDLVALRVGDVVNGRVRCVWGIPRSAKGKRVRGIVAAQSGGSEVARPFSLRVR